MTIDQQYLIDIHAHCVPREFFDLVRSGAGAFGIELTGADESRWRFPDGSVSGQVEDLLVDLETRLKRMDLARVDVQVLSSFIDVGAHHLSGDSARAYARAFNDALGQIVAEHPSRFLALATLPLADPHAAVEELARVMTDGAFVGAELPASCVGDAELDPLWSAAEALGAIIMIHPEAASSADLPYFMGNFVGNPAETTLAAVSLILSGVIEAHRDLIVVLVHGGGFLPYQIGRLERGFAQYGSSFGAKNTLPPISQLRRFHFDTILHDAEALRHLIEIVGADRVVAGTDYPYVMGDDSPHDSIDAVEGLTATDRRLIKSANVQELVRRVHARRTVGAVTVGAAD